MLLDDFFQEGPKLSNQWEDDLFLRSYLERVIPRGQLADIKNDLHRLGQLAVTDLMKLCLEAEDQRPQLVSFDPWGQRIDEIKVSPAWNKLKDFASREGLIAIGYERAQGIHSRIYQFAKLYLYTPSSAMFSCPLAMTDGAARLIELYGDEGLKNRAFQFLTSRDPRVAWTSGQWMTERQGGSDVSRTGTVAIHETTDLYRLHGSKWFTSATTSEMAITLARVRDVKGTMLGGSRGLSIFYLETRNSEGFLNGIRIDRLKDKLGTRALPTAELVLDGCLAKRIGKEGQGVKIMSSLFNITRIYNSVIAVSYMRRALAIARDYAQRRNAFGKHLIDLPLHAETLAQLEVRFRGSFALAFGLCELLGKVECGQATEEENTLLRLLTPVAKLFTAKEAFSVVSEALECMGGAGYIENTDMPRLLRDTQVLTIWEGTTNVLSLDMIRAFEKEKAFPVFLQFADRKLKEFEQSDHSNKTLKIDRSLKDLISFIASSHHLLNSISEDNARSIAYSVARIFISIALMDHATWATKNNLDPLALPTLNRWCQDELPPPLFLNDPAERSRLARAKFP